MLHTSKIVIAIYPRHYLTLSMTFIYRQLIGIADEFEAIVLAKSVENREIFSFKSIFLAKGLFLERIYNRFSRVLSNRYVVLSPFLKSNWKNLLRNKKVSLIHAHFGPSAIEMLPIAQSLNIPLLVTFHGSDASQLLHNKAYCKDLLELFKYAHVITVSADMAKRLQDFGAIPERTVVHYIGVPIDDFKFIFRKPIHEKKQNLEQINFLQVANFVEKKGHRYTVLAFKKFLQYYAHCTLTLAGDGPLLSEVRAKCYEMGIIDKVNFVGKVEKNKVIELMENTDIFLHHSVTASNGDQEGIPTVLMEAMSMGLVVISSYHSGIPELIDDGRTGYLVAEKDVNQYFDKMCAALHSSHDLPILAAKSIQTKFDMGQQNKKLKEIYHAIIAS